MLISQYDASWSPSFLKELWTAVPTGAGQIWASILQCFDHDFPYSGIRLLLRGLANGKIGFLAQTTMYNVASEDLSPC